MRLICAFLHGGIETESGRRPLFVDGADESRPGVVWLQSRAPPYFSLVFHNCTSAVCAENSAVATLTTGRCYVLDVCA